MAYDKTPKYTYQKKPGAPFYLKLPIDPLLRHHFPNAKGKPRTHIVEPLGTAKESEAEQLKRPRLAHYWAMFERLREGKPSAPAPSHEDRVQAIREGMETAHDLDDEGTVLMVLQDAAQRLVEDLEPSIGVEAADALYGVATKPGRLTLLEALKLWNAGAGVRESTKAKRSQALKELLFFLRLTDCLPEYVTESRAVAYVSWLNAGKLGRSTKEDRLSTLNVLWRFLERRREVPRNTSPWGNHEVTDRSTGGAAAGGPANVKKEEKRGWREPEVLALFNASDKGEGIKSAHYTRPLFRELYALGFITGMRLNEIVSLRPEVVEVIPGPRGRGIVGYWLRIEDSKSDAGDRTIPVVHPVAVSILKARMDAQKDPTVSLFPECRPGGPDNKLSWHVQKALGRDRDRLGFGPEVDFHSTRRTFLSMMDNSGSEVVHVQRYVGHQVNTIMHKVYSDGASRESLLKVARAVRYSPKVEAALARKAEGAG